MIAADDNMAASAEFHRRTGSLVTLSNGNRTAQRNHPAQEFNNGVVLSLHPLKDNQLFEVKIDKKVDLCRESPRCGFRAYAPSWYYVCRCRPQTVSAVMSNLSDTAGRGKIFLGRTSKLNLRLRLFLLLNIIICDLSRESSS